MQHPHIALSGAGHRDANAQTIDIPLYAIRHGRIGGTEFAIYNLIRGLADAGARLAVDYGKDADLSPDFIEWARGHSGISLHRRGGLPGPKDVRFLEESWFANRRGSGRWALYPNYFCPPTLWSRRRRRRCVMLHDIQYKRYPEYHSPKRIAWLDHHLPRMFRAADAVILISHSELALVREYFGEEAAARCDVVHNAIDFDRLESGSDTSGDALNAMLDRPYILSVCHQFPHKNVGTLLRAFAIVAERMPDVQLYMVGSASEANQAFIRAALPAHLHDRVRVTGFVSDADLGRFYARARLFVLPSLYEGFGMPAVEALGLGVPTLVSNAYALPEVTMGHARLVNALHDPESWASSIRTMLESGERPAPDVVAHVRSTYAPRAKAEALLTALRAREAA